MPADQRWVLQDLVSSHWPSHDIRFPKRERTIGIGYNSVRSRDLDKIVRKTLPKSALRTGTPIGAVGATSVDLADGERLVADLVLDARGARGIPGLDLGWQKFVGRTYRFDGGHGVERPVIMDGTVAQHDGYRFVYFLPFSATELLIEDTYYSTDRALDRSMLQERLDAQAERVASGKFKLLGEEEGVLPVVMGGDFEALWRASDLVPRLGVRGGFFHPTTSYSLPDAIANAALITGLTDFDSRTVARILRARAKKLWRQRGFFRLLNRMLFRAAEPNESYRVLEHFYRLPPAIIGRFYAADLTPLDKLRVLSGKPPVPLGRALAALAGGKA